MDSTAAQAVQMMRVVQQARLNQLNRAAVGVAARYGAKDPRTQEVQAAVTSVTSVVGKFAMAYQKTVAVAPQVTSDGWALYGHVFNAQGQPASAYTVFLVDAKNAYYRDSGFAFTDDSGYFALTYSGVSRSSPSEPTAASDAEQEGGASSDANFLVVEIANPKGQIVYIGSTPFQPSIGLASYQSINLPVGERVLGDPPAALRKVAMPDTKDS